MHRAVVAFMLFTFGAGAAVADSYPARPIRLIVPFAPGGALDTVARVLAPSLSENLGQPIVVNNQGGGGGVIGMEAASKATPDGYTLLLDHSGLAYMPGLHRTLPFDPIKSFEPVITAVSGIYVLAVNPSVPVKSVDELIKYAKEHPGKLNYGSAGVGSSLHLAGEFFKREAGIDIVHVPYKGASQAVADLIAGQVQMMFGPATAILPLAKAGKVRALAVTSATPSKLASDLPTVSQTLPGFEVVGWYGIAAPAGTPKNVLTKLNADANEALKTPELVAKFEKLGYEPIGDTPDQAAARIKSEVTHWTTIIRDAAIQPQ